MPLTPEDKGALFSPDGGRTVWRMSGFRTVPRAQMDNCETCERIEEPIDSLRMRAMKRLVEEEEKDVRPQGPTG